MSISTRRSADISALGEQGFLACATEERVLGMTSQTKTFRHKWFKLPY